MVRDWTSSKKINKLSAQGERFFTRLIMKADDFGNYPENTKLLNGNLFPEKDEILDSDVVTWLNECVAADVIRRYTVEDKQYIHIIDFKQRLDRAKAKYPQPVDPTQEVAGQMPATSPAVANDLRAELELEPELEPEPEPAPDARLCAVACEIFGRQFEQPADRMAGMANWYSVIEDQCKSILKVYSVDDAVKQVRAYLKHCRDTKRKLIGNNSKVSETILSSDWVKLITPMGGAGSGINVGQNRKVHAG